MYQVDKIKTEFLIEASTKHCYGYRKFEGFRVPVLKKVHSRRNFWVNLPNLGLLHAIFHPKGFKGILVLSSGKEKKQLNPLLVVEMTLEELRQEENPIKL